MAHILPILAPHFIATSSAEDIARRIREDEVLVNTGQPCSWVAWHLPDYNTEQGSAVATELALDPNLSHDIKSLVYENLLRKIRRYLESNGQGNASDGNKLGSEQAEHLLGPSELSTALKVIAHLQEMTIIQQDTPAHVIRSWLEQRLLIKDSMNDATDASKSSNIPKPPPVPRKNHCYVCRLVITKPYPSMPSMCIPCGSFNFSSSSLSTPPRLSLSPDFSALVTGARINLGYHTALRLLRCGASVISTTRYPRDALVRYSQERDFADWRERLKVIGADFRSATDAFALVHEVKKCLKIWADGREIKLGLLINNAAQTLTDTVIKEKNAISREDTLDLAPENRELLIEGAYKARVRGGIVSTALEGGQNNFILSEELEPTAQDKISAQDIDSTTTIEVAPYLKSSWVQSLFEIPYEDVMSAHTVNTFVPLILCRELLPLMGSTGPRSSGSSKKPEAYIVNVSSREGIFEDRIRSNAKFGKHVHTNMSKAALNMITETEAAPAWRSRRVAMNTVDPGYMSAAPEYQDAFDGVRPIGWEDGAGRVLYPLAVGEIEGQALWGRFMKHYGAIDVSPGSGR